jgi:membrane protease YdiL (CAAX protease family)
MRAGPGLGNVFAWLRLSSGSSWPCIWAHGVWNAVIQGPFDMSTAGYSDWVGESGLTTVTMTVFTIVVY